MADRVAGVAARRACTLAAFSVGMSWYGTEGEGLRHAVTIAFMALALGQVAHAFNARSHTRSAFTSRLFTNGWLWGATVLCILLQLAAVYLPWLRTILGTVPLSAGDWGVIGLAALAPVGVVEIVKAVRRKTFRVGFSQLPVEPTGSGR